MDRDFSKRKMKGFRIDKILTMIEINRERWFGMSSASGSGDLSSNPCKGDKFFCLKRNNFYFEFVLCDSMPKR